MLSKLPPRERQIVDLMYVHGEMAVSDICEALPVQLSGSAVRAMLRILEDKGHIAHHEDGPRYVYAPTVARDTARRSAVSHLLKTFFDGSVEQAMAALLDGAERKLSRDEIDRLSRLIEQRKREGR